MLIIAIYLSSGKNRYTTLPFGIGHLDLQVARKEAHGDVDSFSLEPQGKQRNGENSLLYFQFRGIVLRST